MSDNFVVVNCLLQTRGHQSPVLCHLIWQFLHWGDNLHLNVQIRHIPGRLNVLADPLSSHSQGLVTPSLGLSSNLHTLGTSDDRSFATRWNRKLSTFVSPVPDPEAWAVDALSINWEGLWAFSYPPTVLVLI
jgi:hypothetical protein